MKKQFSALLGLGLLLATTSSYAQTIRVKASVPFMFVVGQEVFPAGEYTVQSITLDGSVLSLRDSDQQPKIMVITQRCESTKAAAQTRLVFHRYGDTYFLSQIWEAGNTSGRELPKSSREVELTKGFATQEVVLAPPR